MGEKLPSKRNFAKNLGISTITVENAYAQLIAEGYIYSIPKKGYFVSDIHTILPVEQMHPFEEDNGSSSSIDSPTKQIQNIFPFLSGQGSSGNCSVTVSRS